MEVSMDYQLRLIFDFFVFGIAAGILYDAVRILRIILGTCDYSHSRIMIEQVRRLCEKASLHHMKPHGKVFSCVTLILTDVIYSLTVGISFIIYLYHVNYCIFRWYLLLGAALGFASYYFTVGRIVITAADTVLSLIYSVVFRPIIMLLRLTGRLFVFIWNISGAKLTARFAKRRAVKKTMNMKKELAQLMRI